MPEINIPNFADIDLLPPMLDPGAYMFQISDAPKVESKKYDDDTTKQYIEVPLKVIEGPEQQSPDPGTGSTDPTGRKMTDRIYLTEKSAWKIKQLFVASGVLSRDDKESPLGQGKIQTDLLIGQNVPAEVTINKAPNGKEYRNVNYIV